MSRTIEVPEYEVHDEVRVDPARTALVVVDMQNDFVRHGGSLRGPDAEATIPAILGLLELARAKGMPVGLGDTRPASSRPTPRSEPAMSPAARGVATNHRGRAGPARATPRRRPPALPAKRAELWGSWPHNPAR
jgi:nicotinamidase-related amidase